METRHLKIFTAVYKTRSFTKAAEMLHTSQPTVSEHLQNLEQRLSCRLFDRLGRRILPTAEADILYPRALAILNDMHKLEDELAMAKRQVGGELLIGASTIPGAYFLPQLAAAFKTRHPGVCFEVQISDSTKIVKALLNSELLLGLVGAKLPGRGLHYEAFCEDELILVASSQQKLPPQLTLSELQSLPLIIREDGSGTRKKMETALAEQGIAFNQLNIAAVFGSSSAIKTAVKAGLGSAILSRYAAADDLRCGSLREIAVPELSLGRTFYVVTANKRSLPHHYQMFLTFLQQTALDKQRG